MSNRPHVIDAKTVDPKRAVPRNQPNASTKRLFVTEINSQHTQSQLADYFRKFGNVVNVCF
jgi:RNA recognition motif-containing protein